MLSSILEQGKVHDFKKCGYNRFGQILVYVLLKVIFKMSDLDIENIKNRTKMTHSGERLEKFRSSIQNKSVMQNMHIDADLVH